MNAVVPGNRGALVGCRGPGGGLLYSAAPAQAELSRARARSWCSCCSGRWRSRAPTCARPGRLRRSFPRGLGALRPAGAGDSPGQRSARCPVGPGGRQATLVVRLGREARLRCSIWRPTSGPTLWLGAGTARAASTAPAACLAFLPAVLSARRLAPAGAGRPRRDHQREPADRDVSRRDRLPDCGLLPRVARASLTRTTAGRV